MLSEAKHLWFVSIGTAGQKSSEILRFAQNDMSRYVQLRFPNDDVAVSAVDDGLQFRLLRGRNAEFVE